MRAGGVRVKSVVFSACLVVTEPGPGVESIHFVRARLFGGNMHPELSMNTTQRAASYDEAERRIKEQAHLRAALERATQGVARETNAVGTDYDAGVLHTTQAQAARGANGPVGRIDGIWATHLTGDAMLGQLATGAYGAAQMPRAPGKMFKRSDILAILRAEQARHTPMFSSGDQYAADLGWRRAIADLIQIFENLE